MDFEPRTSSVSGWRFSRLGSAAEAVTCCLAWYDPNAFRAFTLVVLATLEPM